MSTARKSLVVMGLAAFLLLGWAGTSHASMTLVNQNFDSMGSAPGTASVPPAGWTAVYLAGPVSRVQMTPYLGNGVAISSMTPIYTLANLGVEYRTNYYSGTMSDISHVYNCGLIDAADRALGNYPRTSPWGDHIMQVAFSNTTGVPITAIKLDYDMEQWGWSHEGKSSSGPEIVRVLLSSTTATTGFNYMGTGFDGVAPHQGPNGAGASTVIDGNAVGNFVHVSGNYTLPSTLQPGASMWLRFHDWNDNATYDHLLAVDNVLVTGIPEPASLGLLAAGGLLALRRRRR